MDCIPCTLKWPDLSPQPKGHLCWFSHFLQGSWSWQTDQQMNKPVGFHGPIAPPVLNANSSECPQFGMPAEIRSLHAGAARRLLLHAAARWCCTPLPASAYHLIGGGCRNGKFQNLSPPSVLFESSRIFFTIHGRHRRKNDGPEFWNSNSVIFKRIFWNFQKGVARSLCSQSVPLWSRPN